MFCLVFCKLSMKIWACNNWYEYSKELQATLGMKQNNKISNKSFLTQETKNGFNFYSKKIQKFKKKEV